LAAQLVQVDQMEVSIALFKKRNNSKLNSFGFERLRFIFTA